MQREHRLHRAGRRGRRWPATRPTTGSTCSRTAGDDASDRRPSSAAAVDRPGHRVRQPDHLHRPRTAPPTRSTATRRTAWRGRRVLPASTASASSSPTTSRSPPITSRCCSRQRRAQPLDHPGAPALRRRRPGRPSTSTTVPHRAGPDASTFGKRTFKTLLDRDPEGRHRQAATGTNGLIAGRLRDSTSATATAASTRSSASRRTCSTPRGRPPRTARSPSSSPGCAPARAPLRSDTEVDDRPHVRPADGADVHRRRTGPRLAACARRRDRPRARRDAGGRLPPRRHQLAAAGRRHRRPGRRRHRRRSRHPLAARLTRTRAATASGTSWPTPSPSIT